VILNGFVAGGIPTMSRTGCLGIGGVSFLCTFGVLPTFCGLAPHEVMPIMDLRRLPHHQSSLSRRSSHVHHAARRHGIGLLIHVYSVGTSWGDDSRDSSLHEPLHGLHVAPLMGNNYGCFHWLGGVGLFPIC